MADPNDPKTEPVRITPPPRPDTNAPSAATEGHEPVRINLPTRPPVRPAPPPSAAPPPPPRRAAEPAPSAGPELKKETARVGAAPTRAVSFFNSGPAEGAGSAARRGGGGGARGGGGGGRTGGRGGGLVRTRSRAVR